MKTWSYYDPNFTITCVILSGYSQEPHKKYLAKGSFIYFSQMETWTRLSFVELYRLDRKLKNDLKKDKWQIFTDFSRIILSSVQHKKVLDKWHINKFKEYET